MAPGLAGFHISTHATVCPGPPQENTQISPLLVQANSLLLWEQSPVTIEVGTGGARGA